MTTIVAHPARRVAALGSALGLALAYACATSHARRGEEPPHDVNVEVQNDLTIPTVITAYVAEGEGIRRMLGEVGGGEVKTFTFRPSAFGQQYRLIAYRQLARPIYSVPFTIGSPITGTVVWSVYTGIVTFRDRDVVETTYVNPSKGVIHVGGDSTDTSAARRDSTRDTTTKTP